MAFTINEFKHNLKNIARPTLFEVKMTKGPSVMPDWPGDLLTFTCKNFQLPGETIGKIQVPFFGRKVNFAGDVDYQDITMTIISDNRFQIWRALYRWRQAWNDAVRNVASNEDMNAFKVDADLYCFNNTNLNSKTLQVRLVGMFPYDVPTSELAWDNTDTTLDLQVTWMVDYFELPNETRTMFV